MPMIRRIVLLFFCCVALPAQSREARAAAQAARLQAAVDALVPLVEQYAGLRFPSPPRVRGATGAQWRALVKRELELESGADVFGASVSLMGLYVPDAGEVVLSPVVAAPLRKGLPEGATPRQREGLAHHQSTLVHELVHVLQDMHFRLPARLQAAEDAAEILALKYLIEGHAVFVETRVAEAELGFEDFMARSPYSGLAGLGNDPSYAGGHRYFVRVFAAEGMAGVLQRLRQPPVLADIVALARRLPAPAPAPATSRPTTSQPTTQPARRRRKAL